ncbi:uncharacterized protein LOC143849910 isoform X5 [Tasmannia lanceolata]|uniref:uncharacterized protein LOC143849910 isoform X5 n=1 Tax=Tasmannia lanceolata TaxID=3420 RepID=UPI00406425D3
MYNLVPIGLLKLSWASHMIKKSTFGPLVVFWLSFSLVLFPNDSLELLLARMIGILGPIDMEMLVRGQETHKYFTNDYDLYHMNEETNQLEYIIPEKSSLAHHLEVSDVEFIEFIEDLLQTNPERRPTASQALQHPWLLRTYE